MSVDCYKTKLEKEKKMKMIFFYLDSLTRIPNGPTDGTIYWNSHHMVVFTGLGETLFTFEYPNSVQAQTLCIRHGKRYLNSR